MLARSFLFISSSIRQLVFSQELTFPTISRAFRLTMWAVRRSTNSIRNCTNVSLIARLWGSNMGLPNNIPPLTEPKSSTIDHPIEHLSILHFSSPTPFLFPRNFSSETYTKSSNKESDELSGFSDLDEDSVVEESSDANPKSTMFQRVKQYQSPLYKLILETYKDSLTEALENWVKEGNKLEKEEVYAALSNLRTRKLYTKALQFLEWLKGKEVYEFTDRDYMNLVDLNAKVRGIFHAEKYLDQIPESMCTELVYRALLSNCAALRSVQHTERIFKKMQELGFPLTSFTCDTLMLLRMRTDRNKIPELLLLMEKENVKISLFSYNTLIEVKGSAGDLKGMEETLELMKKEGVEPNVYTLSIVARYYIKFGMREKAERILKDMEGSETSKYRPAFKLVLPLYADLGSGDDVARVWELCKPDPYMEESLAVISAWGKLGKVENAEKVFDEMSLKWERISPKYYDKLLSVYAQNKMLEKGKNILKKMINEGRVIGPSTLDVLIRLYVNSDEVRKGNLFLQRWLSENKIRVKPLHKTYVSLLDGYAKKGDYHNAENIFAIIRQNGGFNGGMYKVLLKAYLNAKVPAYGFRERMKADNVVVSRYLIGQLAKIDGFRKNVLSLSDLLD